MKKVFFSFPKMTVLNFLCLVVLSFSSVCQGQELNVCERLRNLQAALVELQKNDLLDGEVMIALHGDVALHLQSQEVFRKKNPQFMIGSLSKQFFAVAIIKAFYGATHGSENERMQQMHEKLHAPISQYLPKEAPVWAGKMPDWANVVTVHQLLSHTSGIANFTQCDEFEREVLPGKKFCELPRKPSEILSFVVQKPLLFSPGTQYAYCNTGYLLISEILTSFVKKPASQYVFEMLLSPLNLHSTVNPTHGGCVEIKQQFTCRGLVPQRKYDPRGTQRSVSLSSSVEDFSTLQGAGSIISTACDLLRWNHALHKAGVVLPPSLYRLLVQQNLNGYGYGVVCVDTALGPCIRHQGGCGTHRALLCYYPTQEVSIVVLCNICKDWDALLQERQKLTDERMQVIPQADERAMEVEKILLQRHPNIRGFLKIIDLIKEMDAH